MKKLMALLLACSVYLVAAAQPENAAKPAMKENWDTGMVNTLKQNGGIYAVIAVIAIIMIGFFLYMVRLDKKITRLEQQQNS